MEISLLKSQLEAGGGGGGMFYYYFIVMWGWMVIDTAGFRTTGGGPSEADYAALEQKLTSLTSELLKLRETEKHTSKLEERIHTLENDSIRMRYGNIAMVCVFCVRAYVLACVRACAFLRILTQASIL